MVLLAPRLSAARGGHVKTASAQRGEGDLHAEAEAREIGRQRGQPAQADERIASPEVVGEIARGALDLGNADAAVPPDVKAERRLLAVLSASLPLRRDNPRGLAHPPAV